MCRREGFNFSICPTPSSQSMVTHSALCHRAEETLPGQMGGSCLESPEHLGSLGLGAGLCPPIPLSTPGTLQSDGGRHSEEDTGVRAAGSSQAQGSHQGCCRPEQSPIWLALTSFAAVSCPPATFLGLKKVLFLKDKSYLVLIHKVNEVLGELLFHFQAQPLQGSRAEVSRRPRRRG